jgi:hypothetical protein
MKGGIPTMVNFRIFQDDESAIKYQITKNQASFTINGQEFTIRFIFNQGETLVSANQNFSLAENAQINDLSVIAHLIPNLDNSSSVTNKKTFGKYPIYTDGAVAKLKEKGCEYTLIFGSDPFNPNKRLAIIIDN